MNDLLIARPFIGNTKKAETTSRIRTTESNYNVFNCIYEQEKTYPDKLDKITNEDIALVKEVGLRKYQEIQQVTRQIIMALMRAVEAFTSYREKIEDLIVSYESKMPRSVNEALERLYDFLASNDFSDQVKEMIFSYIEKETGLVVQHFKGNTEKEVAMKLSQ